MHRFYLAPAQCRDEILLLSGREAHHARHVVRVRPGERISVLNGEGLEFLCEVREYVRDQARLAVIKKRHHPARPNQITLLQAVPKGKIMDAIVQKATELGTTRIVPLLSERVVAHLDSEDAEHKAGKWQSVAVEAIKQCGSAWLPEVEAPLSLDQFFARNEKFELPLIASLQDGSRSARDHFHRFCAQQGRQPKSVCVWIGPEGDFTPLETEAIEAHGALPITLGQLVLRVETAAIYCLSIINHELQFAAF